MRRNVLVAVSAVFLLSISVLFLTEWFFIGDKSGEGERAFSSLFLEQEETPKAKYERDDPRGRAGWEWLSLRDPKTGEIPPNIRSLELSFASQMPAFERSKGIGMFAQTGWFNRGPWNVGGRTRALAVDRTNSSVILAAGATGGIWRSENGGASWTKVTKATDAHDVTSIVQDPRVGRENLWFAATGELFSTVSSFGEGILRGKGLFMSIDRGKTWNIIPVTQSDLIYGNISKLPHFTALTSRIVVDPTATDTVIYIASFGGIFKLSNNLRTLSRILPTTFNFVFYSDIAITKTGVLYAVLGSDLIKGSTETGDYSEAGVHRSTDGGKTWKRISNGEANFPTKITVPKIGIAPSNQNIVYFLMNTPNAGYKYEEADEWISFWKYEFKSGDGLGVNGTWLNRSSNLSGVVSGFDDVQGLNSQAGYDLVVEVKPDNPDVVFFGGTDLYRTTDGLATSTNVIRIGGYTSDPKSNTGQYPNHHPDQHSLWFHPTNPSILFSGHDGGISKTTDCLAESVTWESLNNGYLTTQFYGIAIHPQNASEEENKAGANMILGGMQDNSVYLTTSDDAKVSWRNVGSGDGTFCAIRSSNIIVESLQNGTTYMIKRSSIYRVDPVGDGTLNYLFVNPFELDPLDTKVMYLAGGPYLWRNSDLDGISPGEVKTNTNWTKLANSLSFTEVLGGNQISAVAVSSVKANRVFYGTTKGKVKRMDDAHISTSNPVSLESALFPQNAYVNCIALDPDDADVAIVVFSNYDVNSLFYTKDAGATWSNISGNLEEKADGSGNGTACRWVNIAKDATGKKTYLVGTISGLYTTNSLEEIQPTVSPVWLIHNEIGNVPVSMIKSRSSDGLIVVATHGNGVFSTLSAPSGTSGIADYLNEESNKNVFGLYQNFPNPASTSTVIPFSLEKNQRAKIVLVDALGKEVATILNEERKSGKNVAAYSVSSLSSGIYFYKLSGSSGTLPAKRMVVVR
ncbi:hypothetical protein CHS0354_000644 [Potamilus streckersoni]|uniref:Secretion system C-terminal sorting domain-containing protein n=1 Tax=Potamilus streckersoni TaxID=2493646 RepID=A0AAE0W8G6_9BIVA|nr:hypothetical protein CHS0354_000644 [Potamilus streckersoni]